MGTISDTFATAPSRHNAHLHAYIWPRSHPWPPFSPSPALAQRLHGYAVVHSFTAIFLPYAFIVSIITIIVAIGLRAGFPGDWRFIVVLGVCGWVCTAMLIGLCVILKLKIRAAREIAWEFWGVSLDRQILECGGVYGRARENEIETFMDWAIGGENVGSSALIKRELDEESAIEPAITEEKHRASWGSFRRIDGGNGSDDPDEEGWKKHETVMRDLHMAVHWRQNADEQQRAHREAQKVARLRHKAADAVAAETSSHLETMAQKNHAAVKVARELLLFDIDLGDDESTLPLTGKNDDSRSILSEDGNVGKERDNGKSNLKVKYLRVRTWDKSKIKK